MGSKKYPQSSFADKRCRRIIRHTVAEMPKARITPAGSGRKLAEVVATRIEQDIIARGWPIGVVLGSETELLERYGVSRAAFREAVRIVEHHLVATMRRGPGGGLVVTAPDLAAVARVVTLQLEFQNIEPHHLHEARTALELTCVRLATQRLTPEGITRLREHPARERAGRAEDFHVLVAGLTGNPAMTLFVRVLDMLMRERLAQEPTSRQIGADLHRIHSQIAEAIIAGDVPLAEKRMLKHLETTKNWLKPGRSRTATRRSPRLAATRHDHA
jgi:DNA-binding FadR family transcriptional regulator